MIKNVGLNQNIQIYNTPCFRAKQENSSITNTVNTTNMNGINALASYNYNLVSKSDKFDIPVLEPIDMPNDINSVDGEKICDSKGVLQCIVKENDTQKFIYWVDNDNNKINIVEVIDKSTGDIILSQDKYQVEDFDKTMHDFINVTSYAAKSGMEQCNTTYKDGKLNYKDITIKYPNGAYENRYYNYEENRYTFYNHDGNNNNNEKVYDKNKNLISETFYETKPDGYYRKDIKYLNGKPVSVENKEFKGTNNNEYKNYLNDPNLIPTPYPELVLDIDNMEGIKTYYSNGQIESVKTPDGKIYELSLNGKSVTIQDGNKKVDFIYDQCSNRYSCYIDEDLGDATKRTMYFDLYGSKDKNVTYTKNNISKYIHYENGVPSMYNESDESKEENNLIIGIDFAPNGSVTNVYHSFEERDN